MGGNGSRGRGLLNSELGRNWKTVATIGKIQVVQLKDQSKSNKLPEESHTANRIYAIFEKNGSDFVKGLPDVSRAVFILFALAFLKKSIKKSI